MAASVRPARPGDVAAPDLLYASAVGYYDAFAGSRERALSLLRALFPVPGHSASYSVSRVAEVAGSMAGVTAGFLAVDSRGHARRFVTRAATRLPPPAWGGMVRHLRAAARVAPGAPPGSFYVDALAVAPEHRRRGVAIALLEDAAEQAAQAGATSLVLDTGLDNAPAQALYLRWGMRERGRFPAGDRATEAALGGPGFVSYVKRL